MASDNEVLWIVECADPLKHWVFRTREAARKFVSDKVERGVAPKDAYAISSAKWGPEQ